MTCLTPPYVGSCSGLRLTFEISPVDLKASCSGLADLYAGVAVFRFAISSGGRAPTGIDFANECLGLSKCTGTWQGESSAMIELEDEVVSDRERGWGCGVWPARSSICREGLGNGSRAEKGLSRGSTGCTNWSSDTRGLFRTLGVNNSAPVCARFFSP